MAQWLVFLVAVGGGVVGGLVAVALLAVLCDPPTSIEALRRHFDDLRW